MKTSYIDLVGLRAFKRNQDAYNLERFASLSGGKVTAEQLPSFVDDVVEGYAVIAEGVVNFYADEAHTEKIEGESGKIYVDLAAKIDGSYRYTGTKFVAIGTSVSTADKAINDANGNSITSTYATKNELGDVVTTPTTKTSLGMVQVGENISVDAFGTISISENNVVDALGYTPLDVEDIGAVSEAEINAIFGIKPTESDTSIIDTSDTTVDG